MTRFGSFELDAATRRLTHRGQPVHLTPKAFDLLCLLVDEAPRVVSKGEIYSRVWPNQVVSDATLLGLVKEVRRAIGDDDPDQRLIRTVHRVGYAFEALSETSIAAAVIDRQRVDSDTARHVRPRMANIPRLLAGLAVLSLAAFGVVRLVSEPPRDLEAIGAAAGPPLPALRPSSAEKISIAVLPCADISERGSQAYLSDGIANALSNLLTQIPELRVPGFTSARALIERGFTIPEIANVLVADYLIECSLRQSGDQRRIDVSLIDAQTDTRVWSHPYYPTGDVFAIQDEIAAAVVEQLPVNSLTPPSTVDKSHNRKAQRLYLRARYVNVTVLIESLPQARTWLEEAIELDPDFLLPRLELARTYNLLGSYIPGLLSPDEQVRLVRETIDDAAVKWPDRPEVNSWLGFLALDHDSDLEAAGRYLELALSAKARGDWPLLPTLIYAIVLNRFEIAIAAGEHLLDREPTCLACSRYLMRAYYIDGQYEEVEQVYRAALALRPDDGSGHLFEMRYNYGRSLLQRGEAAAALGEFEALERGSARDFWRRAGISMALHSLQRKEEFKEALAPLRAEFERERDLLANLDEGGLPPAPAAVFTPDLPLASVYAWIGDTDSAFDVLSAYPSFAPDAFDEPILRVMRDHPGWPELAAKAWYPPDARDDISFEMSLPE